MYNNYLIKLHFKFKYNLKDNVMLFLNINLDIKEENFSTLLLTKIIISCYTIISFADKTRFEDYEISLHRRRISVAEDILRSPDDDSISVASAFSQRSDCEDVVVDGIETFRTKAPAAAHTKFGSDPHLVPRPLPPPQLIPEVTAAEESFEERHWRSIVIDGVWHRIDMKVVAPYKKCVVPAAASARTRTLSRSSAPPAA